MASDTLLKDFAIIMAAGAAALVLFRLIKKPTVIGYLLAGAVIGPYVFNGSTVSGEQSIRAIADLGLLVLLFTLGVEFGWDRIRRAGARAIFIGFFEVVSMLGLGFWAGRALGWSALESVFLGAALAQTSSAILIKLFRDMGRLNTPVGELALAVSVVEDLLAVVLLSVLTGIAVNGTSSAAEVSELTFKLATFGLCALVFGAILAPRILRFVDRFQSAEVILMVSLGLCFGLGLIANDLGLSATAGAFLIGTVVGDSDHLNRIQRITTPVRDMFGALFFVSIGMLIDFHALGGALVPMLVILPVFVFGKIIVVFIGAFLTGASGRESADIGAGMPVMGEFGMAISKAGADTGVVGSAFYPVTAGTVVISSLAFPVVQKVSGFTTSMFEEHAPPALRRLGAWLTGVTARARSALGGRRAPYEHEGEVRTTGQIVFANIVIIGMLFAAGAMVMRWFRDLDLSPVQDTSLAGLVIGAIVITLCVPSGMVVWRALADVSERLTGGYIQSRLGPIGHQRRLMVARVLQNIVLGVLVLLIVAGLLPFVQGMFAIGSLFSPVPALVVVLTVLITARLSLKVQSLLENAFRRTILGEAARR